MVRKMRVLVADGQSEVRYALRVLLDLVPELGAEVVEETATCADLHTLIQALSPDLLIADWELSCGLPLHRLRDLYPQLKIIVLSLKPDLAAAALEAGADAFICKSNPIDELISVIRRLTADCQHPG
jgi:DNA-binding NarL/FixJ family response regulator